MPNSQYIATILEGKINSLGGSRKIKATTTSLNGILATVKKMTETISVKTDSLIGKLKEKNVILHKIGETVKADFTGRKAINVSSSMRENETKSAQIVASTDGLEKQDFVKTEEKKLVEEKTNDTTNADTIINALQIFENTNNLGSEEEKTEDMPAYMQTSKEITETQSPSMEEPIESEEPHFEISKENDEVQETSNHESSGYLDGIKAFKAQIGTDKYEEPVRDFTVHTNENVMPQVHMDKPKIDFKVHTSDRENNRRDFKETQMDSDIDDFVKGYYNLDDLSLSKIKSYKTGCEDYVQQARANKAQAGQEINSIDDQMDEKDAQINELYAQIRTLEAAKDELGQSKQEWQNVYSKANTEESLGVSKIDEINRFVYQQFNSINQMDNNAGYSSYSQTSHESSESTGYSRRAA